MCNTLLQGLFSGEIVRDSLDFWQKISLKLAKWEEISYTKQLFSQTILPVFPAENSCLASFGLARDFLPRYFGARIIAAFKSVWYVLKSDQLHIRYAKSEGF